MEQVFESSEIQSAWKACLHMNTTVSPHLDLRGSMIGARQLPQIVSLTTDVPRV